MFQQSNSYNEVESNNGSCVNVNFNLVVKQQNTHHYHNVSAHDVNVASSMTSPPGSPDALNDMSAVSTFIKNSEALLHPSSPPSSFSQLNGYPRTRMPSESEHALNYDQRRHVSMPSIAAAASIDKQEAILNAYQRSRSASLSNDKCSMLSSSPNPCQSPSNLPIVQMQGRQTQRAMSKPMQFNVKTEMPESLTSSTGWHGHNFSESVYPTSRYQQERNLCKSQINTHITRQNGTCSPPEIAYIATKQEKMFPIENQYDPILFNCQLMERENNISADQQIFITDAVESESASNPVISQSHVHQHQHISSIFENRLRPGDLCQRRHHPYLRMAVNSSFPMAVNGTTPYRPRFNRRNNPDLEKKRIHKCTYTGKFLDKFSF